ncbi:putative transcription factor lepB [Lachnellula arida]|uniref:Putative transcription factor lepB n=1 Tax=Lachnellula arida TaxID=1316785 RepID=A0A8T9B6G5_9HELO|nr:putative transcription factor lepB [Lachnellula arida]
MSFSLQRLRSSEISRRMVDRTPLMMGLAGGPSHDVVMDIDTEYQTLLNDAPPFFSMSVADLTTTYQLSPSRAANIAHQGRSFVDPAYASSRDICLRSARLVIQTESQLEKSGIAATRYSFLACLVAVFMASIVVLIDLCYNKAPCQQEQHRGELAEAIRILEQARHKSETAARFLDSLMHVLRKHKVLAPKRAGAGSEQLSGAAMAYNAMSGQPVAVASSSTLGINEAGSIDMADDAFANGEDLSSYFNELAQSFEQGIYVGSFDWNSIFSGLDPVV